MKQFAIIGLGAFGLRMLEELLEVTNEIIIIDKDKDVVDRYKDKAKAAYISDAINEAALTRIIPQQIDAVIVDLGGKIEVSIMTTNYLKKMGIREIIVKAQTDEHGEVLRLVGATRVVFPDREAAIRITPMLASSLMFNFMPISPNFALAEIRVTSGCVGKSLIEMNLRKNWGLNVVAMRKSDSEEFEFINNPEYVFSDDDILLVAGSEDSIHAFSRETVNAPERRAKSAFRQLFKRR